ncbi:MAG TPA: aldose 1-epimerase family protein [Aggregatilinea sp.]|uniref:aldose 1-epimerase family protein n=1 Tax=Aggregatilinea sp. TaxID=2806333 RepID=UPI002B53BC1C|nr:aldose 1-epimerase family protein [Aggregatilinea sp.]HML21018.1 aldose 1-epimerase family protein [Aggregatilinea sp.]
MDLFGKTYSADELRQMVGTLDQLGGVRLGELADGSERGVRVADFYTAKGLTFTALLDRGMDIGPAAFQGSPLAVHFATEYRHSAYYEPQGLGWLRSFAGGLMTGAGMAWMGAPTQDQGEDLGLHGRMSHIPATHVSTGAEWQGDQYVIWVEGQVRETVLFGYNLLLKRRISTTLDGTSLRIEDTVTNDGFTPADHMMLYHCNFGFPFVSPDSRVEVDASEIKPRDAIAEPGLDRCHQFETPVPGYSEQVFFHTVHPDSAGYAQAKLVNDALGLAAVVRYSVDTLPVLTQWKMMGAGEYVCGLEPGTAVVTGRDKARALGQVITLQPGEQRQYDVQIGVQRL